MVRLDKHGTWLLAPSCSTSDLNDELTQSFGGTKVRPKESLIGIEYSYQCDRGEMVSLCEHLSSDENVSLT